MNKISVIIPVYNTERWLERCIESVLNQTYKNFELILVDDGSFDDSGKICDKYTLSDNRVKTIHQENTGASVARNKGIESATGEYVIFVDSDDYIAEEMLENLILKMNDDIDLVVSSIKVLGLENEVDFIMPNSVVTSKDYVSMYCGRQFPRLCLEGPCCKLYRNSILKENNVNFIRELTFGEDEYFNMHYVSHCRKIYCCEDIFYFYVRENENSLSRQFPSNTYEQIDLLFKFDMNVIRQLGCDEKDINNLEKIYAYKMITTIPKSTNAPYGIYKNYVKKISKNKIIKKNLGSLSDKRFHMIGKLVFAKVFCLIYIFCKLITRLKNKKC